MSKMIKNLGIVILAIAGALLLVEGVLQTTDATDYDSINVDPRTGLLVYHPNSAFYFSSACFNNRVVINSQGFHAAQAPVDSGNQGVFRIVVLGDSYTEGLQVTISNSFPFLLQQRLNTDPHRTHTYQVIPLAFSGNGTYQNLLYLQAYGIEYHPDLIIDVVGNGNSLIDEMSSGLAESHVKNDQVVLEMPHIPPVSFWERLKKINRKSKLIRNLYRVGAILGDNLRDLMHSRLSKSPAPSTATTISPPSSSILAETMMFGKMASMAKMSQARLLIVYFLPTGDTYTGQIETFLESLDTRFGIAHADIAPRMADQYAEDGIPQVFPCDGHWNEWGNAVAARNIATLLKKSDLLSR